MKEQIETIIELFRVSRYKEHKLKQFFHFIYVLISIGLIIFPSCIYLFPKNEFIANIANIKIISIFMAILGVTNLTNEYFCAFDDIQNNYKRKLIQHLLSTLNRFYRWQGQCRITLFTLSRKSNTWVVQPIERTGGGNPPGLWGTKVAFKQNEGVPGLAWSKAWDDYEKKQLTESIIIKYVPEEIIGDQEKIKKFYIDNFKVSEETFDKLSEDKYRIQSYMGVGILDSNSSLSALLVIDSKEPNIFREFENMQEIQRALLVTCTQDIQFLIDSEEYEGYSNSLPKKSNKDINIQDFETEINKLSKAQQNQLPNLIKQINNFKAQHKQTEEYTYSDVGSGLLPLEWTLKCLKEILG